MIAGAPQIQLDNPFPGLRSYTSDESHLFFGREGHSDELLRKMDRRRFVAAVGVSGSGKSSLVRAGLLPSLFNGYLASAGSEWRVADFRPGGDPIGNLAGALNNTGFWGGELDASALRSSSLALVGAAQSIRNSGRWPEGENLLILVDQFEELFRFKVRQESDMADRDEKASFVKLLLEAAAQQDIPIYVVITMRSDFLGDCAQFRDLPENINEGQYLIPRMTREQRRSAIEGPIHLAGGAITSRLVQRILNDTGEDPGQLPVMQHALMRTWNHWFDRQPSAGPIDIGDYEAIGTLAEALSRHADEAWSEACDKLPGRDETIVRRVFQRLRDRDQNNREIRKPTPFAELCAIAEASRQDMLTALECFRRKGRSFLVPPPQVVLNDESQVDITHECLLRQWKRLMEWVTEEEESRRIYLRLADRAAEQGTPDDPGFLRGTALQVTLDWWDRRRPNPAWSERYHSGFEAAEKFLSASREHRDRERQREEEARRREEERRIEDARREQEARENQLRLEANARQKEVKKRAAYALAGLLLIASAFSGWSWWRAVEQKSIVEGQRTKLENQSGELQKQKDAAEEKNKIIEGQRRELEENSAELQKQRDAANEQRRIAETKANEAEEKSKEAFARELAAASDKPGSNTNLRLWLALQAVALRRPVLPQAEQALHLAILDSRASLLLRARESEESEMISAVFNRDGTRLLTADRKNVARLWDLTGGHEVTSFSHGPGLLGGAFSADGTRVLTFGKNGFKTWDIASRKEQLVPSLEDVGSNSTRSASAIVAFALSPDGSKLAAAGPGPSVRLWEPATGKLLWQKVHDRAVRCVAFSQNGRRLASGGDDKTARVWDADTGDPQITPLPHDDAVLSLAFSPDGELLVTGCADWVAKVWNLPTGQEVRTLRGHTDDVKSVAFSRDGTRLATASLDNTVKLWHAATFQELAHLRGHSLPLTGVAFHPDGVRLATASDDHTARIWSLVSEQELVTVPGYRPAVRALAFSRDGRRLVSGDADGTVKIWDLASGWERAILSHGAGIPVQAVAFSPDGTRVASLSQGQMKLWDETMSRLLSIDQTVNGDIAFNSDGSLLAFSGPKGPQVYEAATFRPASGDWPDKRADRTVAIAPRSPLLAAGDSSGMLRIYNLNSGRVLWESPSPSPIRQIAFSPDARSIATAHDNGTAIIRDAETGKDPHTFAGHKGFVLAVAFSADGRRLATGSMDKTVKVWDLTKQNRPARLSQPEILTLAAHRDRVYSVAFSPDGQWLASAGGDGDIRLYPASIPQLIAVAGTRLSGAMTAEECRQYFDGPQCERKRGAISKLLQGNAQAREADVVRAAGSFRQAHDLDPGLRVDPEEQARRIAVVSLSGQARTLTRIGEVERASDLLARAKQFDDGLDFDPLAASVRLASSELITAGWSRARAGDYDGAVDRFAAARELDPLLEPDLKEAGRLAAQKIRVEARTAAANGNIQMAADLFRKASELNPVSKSDPLHEAQLAAEQTFLNRGRDLADRGDFEGAKAAFQKARELNPESKLNTEEEARRRVASFFLSQGRSRARAQNQKEALDALEQASKYNPRLKLDPQAEFKRIAAAARIEDGLRLVQAGKASDAIAAFDAARELDPAIQLADKWNNLCWQGAVRGLGSEILPACDRAIALDKHPTYRDSRGVARAQAKDFPGAIDDLQAALAAQRSEIWKQNRRRWIQDLKAGKNPFTAEELGKLRDGN